MSAQTEQQPETSTTPTTLATLVEKYTIRFPLIQRDYAQGRESQSYLRERVLSDMLKAKSDEPLEMDFIYGDTDKDGYFYPIDGQQRLTTLLLLHWYLVVQEGQIPAFKKLFISSDEQVKFRYEVRPSADKFFEGLILHIPSTAFQKGEKPSEWIEDQPWFRLAWKQDPTVSGALCMLDAMHAKDWPNYGFTELINGSEAPLKFKWLPLKEHGLDERLYLRINARGKSLSAYDLFKARYLNTFPDKEDSERREKEAIADCLDGDWLDFFWNKYQSMKVGNNEKIDFANVPMNFMRLVAMITLPHEIPESDDKQKAAKDATDELAALKSGHPGFDAFEKWNWWGPEFTGSLKRLLNKKRNAMETGYSEAAYFDINRFLMEALADSSEATYEQITLFAAFNEFLKILEYDPQVHDQWHDWMRVMRNLAANTAINSDNYRQCLKGIRILSAKVKEVKQVLLALEKINEVEWSGSDKNQLSGFNQNQRKEEILKAKLLLNQKMEQPWRPLIQGAENHPYLNGAIGFLLEFSNINIDSVAQDCTAIQDEFLRYTEWTEFMFDSKGLRDPAPGDFLWERALLAFGDYSMEWGGGKYCFPGNSYVRTWKQWLGAMGKKEHRGFLQRLWDSIDDLRSTEDNFPDGFSDQLRVIIKRQGDQIPNEPESLWRKLLVRNPSYLKHCGSGFIDWIDQGPNKLPRVSLISQRNRTYSDCDLYLEEIIYRFRQGEIPPGFKRRNDEGYPHWECTFPSIDPSEVNLNLYYGYRECGKFQLFWRKDSNDQVTATETHLKEQFKFSSWEEDKSWLVADLGDELEKVPDLLCEIAAALLKTPSSNNILPKN